MFLTILMSKQYLLVYFLIVNTNWKSFQFLCLTTMIDNIITFFLSLQNFTPAAKHQTWNRRRMKTNRQIYSSNIVTCKQNNQDEWAYWVTECSHCNWVTCASTTLRHFGRVSIKDGRLNKFSYFSVYNPPAPRTCL